MLEQLRIVVDKLEELDKAIDRAYKSEDSKEYEAGTSEDYEIAKHHLAVIQSIFKRRLSRSEEKKLKDWGVYTLDRLIKEKYDQQNSNQDDKSINPPDSSL